MATIISASVFMFAVLIISAFLVAKSVKKGTNGKKALFSHFGAVLGAVILSFGIVGISTQASSNANNNVTTTNTTPQVQEDPAVTSSKAIAFSIGLVAMALAMGISGLAGGMAIASAAPAAIAALSENPKTFGKSLVMVVFGESIVIFGMIITVLIMSQLAGLGFGG